MNTQIHWIEGPWPGRLAISPRPRGGEWLKDEIRAWSQSGTSRSEALNLVGALDRLLVEGHRIVIHCRGGIGRSGLLTASLLVSSGIEPEAAIRQVSDARGFSVPETAQQIQWVRDFADAATALTR